MHVDFDVTLVDFDTKSFVTHDHTAREGEPPLDIAYSVIVQASTTPAKDVRKGPTLIGFKEIEAVHQNHVSPNSSLS